MTRSNKTPAKIIFVLLLLTVVVAIALGIVHQRNNFAIPAEAKKLVNPISPSDGALKSIKPIYAEKCANCHGDAGKGDGSDAMMYDPPPADLTTPGRMSGFTDGELFYRISEGKKPMPAFKNRLTEEQRWQLVLLVRSFAHPAK